jgi:uncharacterized protein YukE
VTGFSEGVEKMKADRSFVILRVPKTFAIAGAGLVLVFVALGASYAWLTPYQRCFTGACRERVAAEALQAAQDEWAPRIEAAARDVEEANSRVNEQQARIREIDRAIASVECRKNGKVC